MSNQHCHHCSGRLSVYRKNFSSFCMYCPTCHRIGVISHGPARSSPAEVLKAWWAYAGVSRERR